MELWIRSQDKKHLLKVDNIKWFGGELYTNDIVFLETIKDGVRYLLGIYSNGKRALEVLDDIQRFLQINLSLDLDYETADIVLKSTMLSNMVRIYNMPKE